jgi:hypothetical protein
MIDGDPNHTSTRLRLAALRALNEVGRPVTAHEIEHWLTTNDPELWTEVSEKCYDYVRMILSLTRNNAIVKYRSCEIRPGVDKRVSFYGLPSAEYGDGWIQIGGPKRKGRHVAKKRRQNYRNSPPHEKEPTTTPATAPLRSAQSTTSDADIAEPVVHSEDPAERDATPPENCKKRLAGTSRDFDSVDDQAALEAWKGLTAEFRIEHPLWSQLLSGLSDAKEFAREGKPTRDILESVINKYSILKESRVLNDAVIILSREVRMCREMMTCADIL